MSNTSENDGLSHSGYPLAYFITFSCYGTWLHGRDAGSVDPQHNQPGSPFLPPDPTRQQAEHDRMEQAPYELDTQRRQIVLAAICEVCKFRAWQLLAAHVRSRHVHAVVQAQIAPERIMNDFKSYASRALNTAGLDTPERKRWTRHGSTRYLWTTQQVEECIHYTVHEQGEPMAVFEAKAAP
jgi:REP element-mobilizing transposase RayT